MRIRHQFAVSLVAAAGLLGAVGAQSAGKPTDTLPADSALTRPRPDSAALSASAPLPSPFEHGLAQAEQILKVLAYVIGGAWVYFNYFRGRTHRPRLETKVTCELLRTVDPVLLRVMASAKNAGLSKVDFTDQGSAALIKGYELPSGTWKDLQAISILTTAHRWIEPGETILDEILVRVEAPYPAFLVELWLNSTSKVTWVARTIIGPSQRSDHDAERARAATTAATADAAGSADDQADRRPQTPHAAAATRAAATG